ncbi:MAG: CRISPR-associated endonuclease Cas3'', partial [Clostridium sp.]
MIDLKHYKAKPNKSIREHTDDLINNLEYLSNLSYVKEDLFEIVKLACEYHDYGKANREFQKRIINGTKFDTDKEIAHNVLSLYFINEKRFDSIEDYFRVCFAVVYHHYYCDVFEEITNDKSKKLIQDLLNDFNGDVYRVTRRNINRIRDIMKDDKAILIKGLVNKCDFSASGGTIIEYENKFLEENLEGLLNSWKEKNKESSWNELQEFCIENRDENVMAVAQTGMGKTEAGLLWIGNNKGFFILPLKTAINAIYNRIQTGIVTENIEERAALLHSDSLSYYTNHSDAERDVLEYHRVSKQLSIPLNVATLDQIFDFVFKCQGYEMKLATLSYSKIVIDEIQMYGADLLAYLIY